TRWRPATDGATNRTLWRSFSSPPVGSVTPEGRGRGNYPPTIGGNPRAKRVILVVLIARQIEFYTQNCTDPFSDTLERQLAPVDRDPIRIILLQRRAVELKVDEDRRPDLLFDLFSYLMLIDCPIAGPGAFRIDRDDFVG